MTLNDSDRRRRDLPEGWHHDDTPPYRWPDDRAPERGGRIPRWQWIVAVLVGLAGGCGYLVLAGCSSPTETPGAVTVTTAYGAVTVLGPLDPDEVRAGVERGYDDVARQGYTLRAEGMTVAWSDATDRHGAFHPRLDLIEVVHVAAIPHEIGHRAAVQLVLPCWREVGHGKDLRCAK